MIDIYNGVQLIGSDKSDQCMFYFQEADLYIAKNKLPLVLKNITNSVIEQIGDFFYFYGNSPETAAQRIDFEQLSIRMDNNILYIIGDKIAFESYPISPSEFKKLGIWLRKRSKI